MTSAISITMLVIGVFCLIIGLLLSGSGSTTGLSSVAGEDIELFKKTKERGLTKILQMIMFILMFVLIILGILVQVLG